MLRNGFSGHRQLCQSVVTVIKSSDVLNTVAAFSPQALLPLLERVRELAQSDQSDLRLGQDLQPLLRRVELVLHDCHTSMQQWNKPRATGVGHAT
jgi:hypothetical protein